MHCTESKQMLTDRMKKKKLLAVCRDYRFVGISSLQKLTVRRNYRFAEIIGLQKLPVRRDYRLELNIVS